MWGDDEMDIIVKTTHKELPKILDTLSESEIWVDLHDIKHEDLGNDMITTWGALYVLNDLGISVIEGDYCTYDEKYNGWTPDFSVTLIYNTTFTDDFDFNDYVYWEQDSPMTTIHNFLSARYEECE